MSKAIVVRGANFSINKLGTVTLTDIIPCNSLTLSASAVSLNGIGTTYTLTATATPGNTTDTVMWASSDENILSVSGGVVTVLGVGTATVTAICGERTASCVFTLTHTMDTDDDLHIFYGYRVANSSNRDYCGNGSTNYGFTVDVATNLLDGYRLFPGYTGNFENAGYPIPIPKGATKIRVEATSSFNDPAWWYVLTCSYLQPTSTAISGEQKNCSRTYPYPQEITANAGTNCYYVEIDLTNVDDDVDSFAVSPYSRTKISELSEYTITVIFS